jgi:hypothetical protein
VNNALMFATGNNATGTPLSFYAQMDALAGGFVCDMAADQQLALHENWYGPDHPDPARRDCLTVDWPTDGPVWLNPPYSEAEAPCVAKCKKKRCAQRGWHTDVHIPGCLHFVEKAIEQGRRGVETWMLLAARTDVAWFHYFLWDSSTQDWMPRVKGSFIRGRLVFRRAGKPDPAPFPSMLITINRS